MRSLKSLAQGFLVSAASVYLLSIFLLFKGGDSMLAMLYFLVLTIPASSLTYLKLKNPRSHAASGAADRWRYLIFSFQGVVLAFWMFDIVTTFYAINVTGLAYELNPLGWPLGILGAAAYYIPTTVFSYILLFKMKEPVAFYAAIPLTLLTLGMGLLNLNAGAQNFQVFVDTAALATDMQYGLLALTIGANLAVPFVLKRMMSSPKAALR